MKMCQAFGSANLHFSQINNKEAHISDKMFLGKHLVKDRGAPYEPAFLTRTGTKSVFDKNIVKP